MTRAVKWQRVEELVIFAIGLITLLALLCSRSQFLGYLLRSRMGAFCFNAVHIYAFGAASFAFSLI